MLSHLKGVLLDRAILFLRSLFFVFDHRKDLNHLHLLLFDMNQVMFEYNYVFVQFLLPPLFDVEVH